MPFLYFRLVLIEGLQTLHVDVGDAVRVCLFNVGRVCQHAGLSGGSNTLRLD